MGSHVAKPKKPSRTYGSNESKEHVDAEVEIVETKPLPSAWVVAFRKRMTEGINCCPSVLGGQFTVRQGINLHKFCILPTYIAILAAYNPAGWYKFEDTYGAAAAVLLVCHTVYGLFWIYKDIHFPDKNWQAKASLFGIIQLVIQLGVIYCLPMWCLVTKKCYCGTFGDGSEIWLVAIALLCFLTGCLTMFLSDIQKFVQLKYNKGQLVDTAMFAYSRNPNYFGEALLYLGFGILSCHWICIIAITAFQVLIFVPNILAKDASLSRYERFEEWKSRTGLFFPNVYGLFRDFFKQGFNRTPSLPWDESKAIIDSDYRPLGKK